MKYIEITKTIWNSGDHSWSIKIKDLKVKYFKHNRLAGKLVDAIVNDSGAVKHNGNLYDTYKTAFRSEGKPVYIVTENGSDKPCLLLASKFGKWATDNCFSVDEDIEFFEKYGFETKDIRN